MIQDSNENKYEMSLEEQEALGLYANMLPMVDSELLGSDIGQEIMRTIRNSDLHGLEVSLK